MMIGQYVHGNEPSHHVIYFYPQVGHPEKAAERIREVFDTQYHVGPEGLCGNDDCGQMSAWYLFSAMGFYPFDPCGGEYVIGAPQLPRMKLRLKDGKTFTVVAKNLSKENKYVKAVSLNGRPVTDWKIRHADILKGGTLVFEMSAAKWGSAAQASDIAQWDPNMALKVDVVTNGVKWIDGSRLPIEGRAFDDVDHYYDRLPANVTSNVNGGVRWMKHHTAGMQFRFVTDSKELRFRWMPYGKELAMDHMPATGVSGIDVYRWNAQKGRWTYVQTGRIQDAEKGGSLHLRWWKPGTPCLVNLPLYNGVKSFSLGVDENATVKPYPHPNDLGMETMARAFGKAVRSALRR